MPWGELLILIRNAYPVQFANYSVPERKVTGCLTSPPFAKGDLLGFQRLAKSPSTPLLQKGEDLRSFRTDIIHDLSP